MISKKYSELGYIADNNTCVLRLWLGDITNAENLYLSSVASFVKDLDLKSVRICVSQIEHHRL
jgi:hypothetical protein